MPAGLIASLASPPPSGPAIPELLYHSEESAAGDDSVRDDTLALDLLSAPSRPETATALPRGEDSQGRLKHSERKRRKRAWNALLRAGPAAAADVSGPETANALPRGEDSQGRLKHAVPREGRSAAARARRQRHAARGCSSGSGSDDGWPL